jgi:hypothetical protein
MNMWSYYGAKTNIVGLYPPPKYDIIIEPFAGSARYALKYWDREIILIDKYPVIVGVWKWLQQCSEKDILSLPRPGRTDDLRNYTFDCKAALDFMGFIVGCGAERPRFTPTDRKTVQRPNHVNYNLQRIAKNLFKIRNWTIKEGDYTDAPDLTATWFINPPYKEGGQSYVMSNKHIDFTKLAEWSRNRKGQAIVCENTKADWMDFVPIIEQRGSLKKSTEAMWTNMPTSFNACQQSLFQ